MKKIHSTLALWGAAVAIVVGAVLLVRQPAPRPPELIPQPGEGRPKPSLVAAADNRDARRTAPDAGRGKSPTREKDFPALAEEAMAIGDEAERQKALALTLKKWFEVDPAGIAKYIMLLEVKNDNDKLNHLANALNGALGGLDPHLAASEAMKEPIRRLLLHLARLDPDAALDLANTWLDTDTREAVSVNIARTFAQRDPEEGLQLADRLTSPLRRMQAFAAVGAVWARSDPSAALNWAARRNLPTEEGIVLNAALTSLAQDDPHEAARRLAAAERVMAEAYEDRYHNDLATMNVSQADLANDPTKYREMLEAGEVPPPTSPDVELMRDAARVVARKLASEQPTAAVTWAEALENDLLRLDAIRGAVEGWGRTDPTAAANFAAASYASHPDIVATVYNVWAEATPDQAAAGTRLLEASDLRAAATQAVVDAWAVNDPVQAAEWVDRLPAEEQTDAVQLAVVSGMSSVDPIDAWHRAQTIRDPSLQYRGLKEAFSTIVTQEPDIARDLLAAATLNDTASERLHDLLAAGQRS